MPTSRRAVVVAHVLALLAVTGCAGDPDAAYESYVALGDSYSAAPGVPVTEQESGCARSTGNYPARVAALLEVSYVDATCGGASTLSMVEAQQTDLGPVPPQLEALSRRVDLVTLGIGANDGLFAGIFGTCLELARASPEGTPCRDAMATPGGGDRLSDTVGDLRERLDDTLREVKDRAPRADVVLVGYPQPVPASGTCDILPLADGDYGYVRSLMVELGRVMEDAADAAGVIYVDLLGPSEGHDICAGAEAWVNGVVTHPDRAMGLHPFAAEQSAVADLIVSAL